MTESKPGTRGRRALGRAAVAALAAVAVTSSTLSPSSPSASAAHAAGPDGQGWDLVTGFNGAQFCNAAGEAMGWSGEISQFSCVPRTGGFSLYVKRPRP
ncbi:hypothetical protein [Actinomadura sp. 21ATH]|uniref:hypothetical protein n=1 Tax=Actinomadura sp. 21ATH TaxID=1735444 RepID=UPI0035BEDA05